MHRFAIVLSLGLLGGGQAYAARFAPDESCDGKAPDIACNGTIDGFAYTYSQTSGSHKIEGKVAKDASQETLASFDPMLSLKVTCNQNPVDDKSVCVVMQYGRDVNRDEKRIAYSIGIEGSRAYPCVGYDHFPGSRVRLRLDKSPALVASADAGGCFAANVVKRVIGAASVVSEYTQWPDDTPLVTQADTVGLAQAVALARFLRGKLNGQ